MSTGTTNVRRERSWTQQQDRAPNRGVAMTFLGLSALSLFILFVWLNFSWTRPPQTFVASLAIRDYKYDVPKIRLGEWDLDKVSDVNGLAPWERVSFSTNPQNNEEDVKSFFTVLTESKKLDKQKDTAIIQLRCHAAVTEQQGSEGWSCGLYINDDRTADKPFPIANFLELAASVPAKNIVVFAEIADLQFEPHLGWVINPIEHYIRKACEHPDWKTKAPDKNVWFVLSNADFQPPLFSEKRSKTLFQEACEESLKEVALLPDRGKSLTLARYFDGIYRYCHTASKGRQTPLLILANKSHIESSAALRAAGDVFISNFKTPKSNEEKGEEKLDKDKADSIQESPPSNDNKDAQDPKSAKPVEKEPGLRFWQIRDEIDARGADGNLWSPRDFAPFLWRKLQADVAKASALATLNSDQSSFIKEQKDAMELLLECLSKGQPAKLDQDKKDACWSILHAWDDFLLDSNSNSRSSFRQQWQNQSTGKVDETTGLIGAEIETWQGMRREYRSYIDCLAELGSWIELTAEFASAGFPEQHVMGLKRDCKELISELVKQKEWIPQSLAVSAKQRSNSLRLANAFKIRKSLHGHIKDAMDSSNLVDTKADLSWLDERMYQVLLSSQLITYEQRSKLVKAMKDRVPKKVETKTDVPKSATDQVSELESRCEMLWQAWPLFSMEDNTDKKELGSVPKKFELLDWGKEYQSKILKLDPLDHYNSIAAWHFWSLVDTRFAAKLNQEPPSKKSWPGIVVAPIDPKTIRLTHITQSLNFPEGKSDLPLKIKVLHFDGTPVPPCDLNWNANLEINGLIVKYQNKPIASGEVLRAKPESNEIVLNCSLPARESPTSGTQILVRAGNSNPLPIPVFRNAERIGLVARRLGEPVPTKELKGTTEKKEPFVELKSPAIDGATSQYSFALINNKNADRSVGLKVYASPSLKLPTKMDPKLLVAESEADLLAMKETPVLLKPIEPKQNNPKSISPPWGNLDALNSMLIFEITEFDTTDPKNKKPKGKALSYEVRFKPLHPRDFVDAVPKRVQKESKYSIGFEAGAKLWQNRYGLEELDVLVGEQALVNGDDSTGKRKLKLTAENPAEEFEGSLVDNKGRRFWIDIGGFPRALVYDANPGLVDMQNGYDDQVKIVEFKPILDESSQIAYEKQGASVATKKEVVVFPRLIDGVKAKWQGIEIALKMDKALSSSSFYEIVKQDEKKKGDPIGIYADRSYRTKLIVEEDKISIGYSPDELKIRHTENFDVSEEGAYVFRIHTGKEMAEQKFLIDRTPPEPSFVDADRSSESNSNSNEEYRKSIVLYKGEEVDIWVDTVDTAGEGTVVAGADQAEFKLCTVLPRTFDESSSKDILLAGVVTPNAKGVGMKLNSDVFKGRLKGIFWITAKTIDRAGNFQTRNKPLRVDWRDAERPTPPK